jgi:hypothetical protein
MTIISVRQSNGAAGCTLIASPAPCSPSTRRSVVFAEHAHAFTVASLLLVAVSMPVTLPSPIPWPCPRCETNYGVAQEHLHTSDVTWYRCPICDNAWSVRTYRKRNAADEFVAEPITS